MEHRKFQYLILGLLAATLFGTGHLQGQEAELHSSPTGTVAPTPSPSPAPLPTPRHIPIALHFRRPAKIIPVYREGGETEMPLEDFEIADDKPWLTEADIRWVEYWPEDDPKFLRLALTPQGVLKYSEAAMGNYGRRVILVVDGTVRAVAPLQEIGTKRKDRLVFSWTFTSGELAPLQAQFAIRPPPTPTPAPSPTPVKRDRFIIR